MSKDKSTITQIQKTCTHECQHKIVRFLTTVDENGLEIGTGTLTAARVVVACGKCGIERTGTIDLTVLAKAMGWKTIINTPRKVNNG